MTRLRVHVRPSGRADRLRGWHPDGGLRVEVAAPPEEGRANEAVVRLLANALGVPRASVSVKHGAASKVKSIEVSGIGESEIRERLQRGLDDPDARNR